MMLTSTHWGAYEVSTRDGRVTGLSPFAEDRDPSPIGPPIAELLDHPTRIRHPAVRRGWLDHGPAPAKGGRGSEPMGASGPGTGGSSSGGSSCAPSCRCGGSTSGGGGGGGGRASNK